MKRFFKVSLSLCRAFCLGLMLTLPEGAAADQAWPGGSRPIGMRTGDEARGWLAVGKLILGERGFCTGVLIEPALVLTAAHCLYDKLDGSRIPEPEITFQPGLRNGRAEAYRGVRRARHHENYVFSTEETLDRVLWDLALLELDRPIRLPQMQPFAIGQLAGEGGSVTVVSYAKDRAEVPSIERGCRVMVRADEALILSCDIDFGSSGAPVFAEGKEGPEVVSLISAKADYRGRKVALAVPLEPAFSALRDTFGGGGFGRLRPQSGVAVQSGSGDPEEELSDP